MIVQPAVWAPVEVLVSGPIGVAVQRHYIPDGAMSTNRA